MVVVERRVAVSIKQIASVVYIRRTRLARDERGEDALVAVHAVSC